MSISGASKSRAVNPRMVFLVLAGAVAIGYVVLGGSLLRQHAKQQDMTSQLDSAQAVLASADDVRREAETLPARLTAVGEELAAAEAAFPSELDSNDIMRRLLALADESKVSVMSADTISPSAESAGQTDVPTTIAFNLEVAGELGRLVRFVDALGEGATSTTTISTLSLQEQDAQYVLNIGLVAHARSLAEEPAPSADEGSTGDGAGATNDGETPVSE